MRIRTKEDSHTFSGTELGVQLVLAFSFFSPSVLHTHPFPHTAALWAASLFILPDLVLESQYQTKQAALSILIKEVLSRDNHEDTAEMGSQNLCCSCFMEALLLSSTDSIQEKDNHPLWMGGKHLLQKVPLPLFTGNLSSSAPLYTLPVHSSCPLLSCYGGMRLN